MKTVQLSTTFFGSRRQAAEKLVDPSLWEQTGATVKVTGDEVHGWDVQGTAPIDMQSLPSALASRLPQGAQIHQTFRLEKGTEVDHGVFQAQVPGVPVDVDVDLTIAPRNGLETESTVSAVARIASSVPLFGAMIESALAPMIERVIAKLFQELNH